MTSGFEPRDPDYDQRVRGEVVRPGRTLTICRGDAYAVSGDGSKHVATMLATMTGVAEGNR